MVKLRPRMTISPDNKAQPGQPIYVVRAVESDGYFNKDMHWRLSTLDKATWLNHAAAVKLANWWTYRLKMPAEAINTGKVA